MRRALSLVAVGVTVLALVVGAALATPRTGVTSTPLTRATLGKFEAEHKGIEVESERTSADVVLFEVVFEPGGSTGWHHHPGVGLASVKSGTVTVYDEECHKSVYKAGEGFLERHDQPLFVRNSGKVDAVIYATHIVPTKTSSEELRIDDPQPKDCNVK